MARIRTVKPEFFSNESLSQLHPDIHLLAAALLCYADDEGYFNANPGLVKAATCPLRESSLSTQEQLSELARIKYIRLFKSPEGKSIGFIEKFSEHQRINRATKSRLKPHGGLSEDSLQEGKGKEGKGREQEIHVEKPKQHPIEPEMVTSAVLETLMVSGTRLRVVLDDICRLEMNGGSTPGDLRDRLVQAWRDYEVAKPNLAFTPGAEKFFGEGMWRDKMGWPWKQGQAPAPPRKYLTA